MTEGAGVLRTNPESNHDQGDLQCVLQHGSSPTWEVLRRSFLHDRWLWRQNILRDCREAKERARRVHLARVPHELGATEGLRAFRPPQGRPSDDRPIRHDGSASTRESRIHRGAARRFLRERLLAHRVRSKTSCSGPARFVWWIAATRKARPPGPISNAARQRLASEISGTQTQYLSRSRISSAAILEKLSLFLTVATMLSVCADAWWNERAGWFDSLASPSSQDLEER